MTLQIRYLEDTDYYRTWRAMQSFTETRDANTADEIWFTEHQAVFTQGQAGKPEHILAPGDIPVVQTDRGGQVTYHGPGQIVAYTLFDLKRLKRGIRWLVCLLEEAVLQTLAAYGIRGHRQANAPGVYVNGAKLCSLGLRVRRGASYHGLALNVAMDTSPFQRINPCGFQHLAITQMRDFVPDIKLAEVRNVLLQYLTEQFYQQQGKFHERSPIKSS